MGKLGKVFGVIVLLVVVVVVGLVAVVKIYLTEERVKALVIPQAESALGRKVAIGDIKIGLFSGITIKDFIIKEADGQSNFVSTKAFVLSYDLMPLLQKKLVVSEIRLDDPTIAVSRNKQGKFNYSTLAILSEPAKQDKPKTSATEAAAVPLALTIDQIRLVNAKLSVRDALNELPKVDATTNAKLKVSFGQNMTDLRYQGGWDLVADVEYAETKAHFDGSGNISQQNLDVDIGVTLDEEQVQIKGDIKNYAKSPNANLDINSKSLNIDKLLSMAGALPKSQSPKPAAKKQGTAIADTLPSGLVAKGTVKVDKAMYKGLTANNFALLFSIDKGILTVSELSANAYGGKLDSTVNANLNKPDPVYDGKLSLDSMQADGLTASLIQKAAGMLTGSLQSSVNFSGAGTTWDKIKNVLTADGTFSLEKGGITGIPASTAVANLLGLPELNNISYENISGTFKIVEGGMVQLNTQMKGNDISADADGIIGLDGSLDMPVTLHLSPALAEKLKSRASFTQYLADGEGGSTLNLKLAGTVTSPKPTLDMKGVQDQLQKTLQKKLLDQGGETQTNEKSSPENMIKGLFGK
jgi:AsmA protein